MVRRHVLLSLLHYDKPSLLAGKLHALIHRPHVKGRDVYDLMWYLSDPSWPQPNLQLLRSALAQTGMEFPHKETINWKQVVEQRIRSMTWDEEISMLTQNNILSLLKR